MAKSIIQNEYECFFCGSVYGLEEHHIFAGVANRKISEKYGLKVLLCNGHHTGYPGHSAQYNKELNLQLKQLAQKKFEEIHGHELWMKVIKKNYL